MELCSDPNFLQVFYILKIAFKIVLTIVPIIFMVFIFKDIFMAVVNAKPEDELKGVISKSIKRFIAAIIIYFLPSIFTFIFNSLLPIDSTMNICFENATIEKINEYKSMSLEERKEEIEKRKEELKNAALKREEQEQKENETQKEAIKDRDEQEFNGGNGTSTVAGNSSNPNLILKSYSGVKNVKYWELVPDGIGRKPALVVFLHGSGECGDANGMLRTGLPKFMNNGSLDNYNAIFIAPNTSSCSWSSDAASTKDLIDYIVKEYNIDTKHIVITGHSLGGNGTWNMLTKYPNLFSKAVSVSGCPSGSVDQYLNIPIRSYVGASESSYYKSCNNNYVPSINNKGGDAEYILVPSPNDNHGSVINIYGDSELINWMLS